MAENIKVSPKKRGKLIDALLNIRLILSIKKLISDYIKKQELKKILDDEKKSSKDLEVSASIDDLFKEYFEVKTNSVGDNKSLTINQMSNMINNDNYQSLGDANGKSLVKVDDHHKKIYEFINPGSDSRAA